MNNHYDYILRYREKITAEKKEIKLRGKNASEAFETFFNTLSQKAKRNIMDFEVIWDFDSEWNKTSYENTP